MSTFNPLATATATAIPKTHNRPPEEVIFEEINDLFEEAKNWADGEPITSEEMHDAVTKLYDGLHDAGKRADALRVEQKKPLDDAIKAIQDAFNPYVQAKRGKVDMGKSALGDMLSAWRTAKALAAQQEAARIAEEAAEARRVADAAIQSSSGNLAAREQAEAVLADAKRLEKTAKRADKAATTGTGLRTTWVATLVDEGLALDWAYARAKDEFLAVVQRNADEAVRGGVRAVPGFAVEERKVAV